MPESTHPNYRLQDLQRRWERDPSSRVYQQLAEEYRKADQLVEAAVVLEDGLGRRPNDIAARVALGRCRLELGQTPEAIEALENVLARDAAHHVANKLLLDAYLRAGDLVQAKERLEIYRLLNDRDPELEHLGFRLQQLAEGGPASAEAPSPQEPEAPWAAAERHATALPSEGESEDIVAEPPAHDVPEVFPSAAEPLEEALNMANPTNSGRSKANDVFDLGVVDQEVDGFAALWAELGYSLTPPSSALDEMAATSPSPLFDAAEPPEEDEDETLSAAPLVTPQPALDAKDDLAANPFGQLMEPASEAEPVNETADIWQTISDQVSQQAAPEPVSEAEPAIQAGMSSEAFAAMADAPTIPLADVVGAATSFSEEASSAPVEEAPEESLAAESGEPPPAALEEEETRPLELDGDVAPAEAAPVEPAVESDVAEPAQSPWEAAWQAEAAAPEPAAPEPAAPEPAAPEPAAPQPLISEEPALAQTLETVSEPSAPDPEVQSVPEPAAAEEPALVQPPETVAEPAPLMAENLDETPAAETTAPPAAEEEAEATVTLGSLYLKQGHREEAARIFEKILRRSPGNQAALAGLNLARKSEMSSLSAMDLLADQSLSGTIPADVHAKKILVLSNYLQHLKAHRTESHVH